MHILSAMIWIGGMIAIRFAVHFSVQHIEEPKVKLGTTLKNLQNFFNMVIPSIIVLLLTALIMILAVDYKASSLNGIVHAKESIWSIMTLIFVYIYSKKAKALKSFNAGDYKTSKSHLEPIAKYLIPLNIFLGLGALYLGVILRGI